MKVNIGSMTTRTQSPIRLVSASTSNIFKNTMIFNEGSFMSRLKNMYEKRTNEHLQRASKSKHSLFNLHVTKRFKSSQSTLDTEEDGTIVSKSFRRNQSEKIQVHPIFRQQQKYLTPKIYSPSSSVIRILHPVYLSPGSFNFFVPSSQKTLYHNLSANNIYDVNHTKSLLNQSNSTNDNSLITITKPNIRHLLYNYISLVLLKSKKTQIQNPKSQERSSLNFVSKLNSSCIKNQHKQCINKQLITSEQNNNISSNQNIIIENQISEIFNKFPSFIQNQLNKMKQLKIHYKYCENMFDLIHRKLDICNNSNKPITTRKAMESNLYNEMIEFIYKHKNEYAQHKDFTVLKEVNPQHVYMQSMNEKYCKKLKVKNINKDNNSRRFSSKNELKNIREKRLKIQNIIERSKKENKVKEKKFREINVKRLEYYARKEDEHDYTKLHYIKKYETKNDKYMKNKIYNNIDINNIEIDNSILSIKQNTNFDENSIITNHNNSSLYVKQFYESNHSIDNATIVQDYSIHDISNSTNYIYKNNSISTTNNHTNKLHNKDINTHIINSTLHHNNNQKEKTFVEVIKDKLKKELEEQIKQEELDKEKERKPNKDNEKDQDENEENIQKRIKEHQIQLEKEMKTKQIILDQIEETSKKQEENDISVMSKEDVVKLRQRYQEEHNKIRELSKKTINILEPKSLEVNKYRTFKHYNLLDAINNNINTSQIKEQKMKELKAMKLSNEINYFLSVEKPNTETQKNLVEEFKEKLNSFKQLNEKQYISYINENYEYIQEELESIRNIKTNEKQINDFIYHLNYDRQVNNKHRELLGDMVKFKDTNK